MSSLGASDFPDGVEAPPSPARCSTWKLICERPLLYYCPDFLTPDECDAVIRLSLSVAGRSLSAEDDAKIRVDLQVDCLTALAPTDDCQHDADAAVLRSIERRVAALSGVSAHGDEMPWAVHFTPTPSADEPSNSAIPACPTSTVPPARSLSTAAFDPPEMQRSMSAKARETSTQRPSLPRRRVGPSPSRRSSTNRTAQCPPKFAEQAPPNEYTSQHETVHAVGGPHRMSLGLHVDTNNCRERRWVTFIAYLRTVPPSTGGHTVFPLASVQAHDGGKAAATHRHSSKRRLIGAAEELLRRNVHHTGQASHPLLGDDVNLAAQTLLMHAESVATAAARSAGRWR